MWWLVGIALIWTAVAIPAAVVLGKMIRCADQREEVARESRASARLAEGAASAPDAVPDRREQGEPAAPVLD